MTTIDSPDLRRSAASDADPAAAPTGRYRLVGAEGCGSAIVEAAFAMADIRPDLETLAFDDDGGVVGARIGDLNPLREVPVLILPDGTAMTESGAMILHLAEAAPDSGLAPPPDAPDRTAFLHRLMLLCGSIYPTYVGGALGRNCGDALMERRKRAWRGFEAGLGDGPWVLGERFSALDFYLAVMTRWTPGVDWFRAECPKVAAIAWRAGGHPALAPVLARNFPGA